MKDVDVIVMGQNYSTTLGLIQAAGEAGFVCGVAKNTANLSQRLTPEQKSNYVSKYIVFDRRDDKKILDALIDNFSQSDKKIVLLPADDFCSLFIDRHLTFLEKYFYIPNSRHQEGEVKKLMDKQVQSEMATQAGLETAKNWSVQYRGDESLALPSGIIYPCITKPQISVGTPKTHIRKCNNETELRATLYDIFKERPCDVLIEEFINISYEYTVPILAYEDEVLIPAFIRKSYVGSGDHRGVTISGKVVNSNNYAQIVDSLKRLIKNAGLNGLFDIELFESSGRFYFNELNLRNGAAGYALTRAGINLPALWIKYCMGNPMDYKNESLKDGLTFVSDKAVLDSYSAGYIDLKTYRNIIKNADFRFIVDNPDMGAKKAFRKIEIKTIISSLVNKFF